MITIVRWKTANMEQSTSKISNIKHWYSIKNLLQSWAYNGHILGPWLPLILQRRNGLQWIAIVFNETIFWIKYSRYMYFKNLSSLLYQMLSMIGYLGNNLVKLCQLPKYSHQINNQWHWKKKRLAEEFFNSIMRYIWNDMVIYLVLTVKAVGHSAQLIRPLARFTQWQSCNSSHTLRL